METIATKLARMYSKKNYYHPVLDYEDLYQEALLTMLTIDESRLPQNKKDREAYITQIIKNRFLKILSDNFKNFKITKHKIILLNTIYGMIEKGLDEHEILKKLKISFHQYQSLLSNKKDIDVENISSKDINEAAEACAFLDHFRKKITNKEKTILDFCLKGFSSKEIGMQMGVSTDWARIQIRSLYEKIKQEYYSYNG